MKFQLSLVDHSLLLVMHINCKDGKMKLTFGNMTMEVNVFNLLKQPMGFDDIEHSTLHWVEDLACEN